MFTNIYPHPLSWHRPSLDVIGLVSGHTGDGIKTILPARAIAKLSSRIVPNMDPQKTLHALKTHLIKHAPPTANISFVDVEFSAVRLCMQQHTQFSLLVFYPVYALVCLCFITGSI